VRVGWHIKGLSAREREDGFRGLLARGRDALASQAGVSLRLVAEFERGQRSNVSLESALRLFKSVGITVLARAPHGGDAEIRGTDAARLERAARAARRRETWTSRRLGQEAPA